MRSHGMWCFVQVGETSVHNPLGNIIFNYNEVDLILILHQDFAPFDSISAILYASVVVFQGRS